MAGNKTFHCQLITPEAAMVDVHADQVVFTAHDGEVGILLNRAPLLCKLGIGEMRVTTEQSTQRFYVDGGFAHVIDNEVTILTERALAAEDIDPAEVEQELANLAQPGERKLEDAQRRELMKRRARTKMKLAKKK
jgi:F-type H+-transporting ATPase subunit epsilon